MSAYQDALIRPESVSNTQEEIEAELESRRENRESWCWAERRLPTYRNTISQWIQN